jgi:hypothetical protein
MTQSKNLLQKLIYNSVLLATLACIQLTSFAGSITIGFQVVGFNGLNISTPTSLDENPNSTNHSAAGTLTLSPSIPDDIVVTAVTNSQCTVTGSPLTLLGTVLPGSTIGNLTFTAVNDGILEPTGAPCTVTYTFTSLNPLYNGTQTAVITIVDWNPQVLFENVNQIDENPLALNHSNQIRVKLSDQPSSPVTLVITYDSAQITITPVTITLDASNWNTGVLVTTTAINDGIQESSPLNTNLKFTASPTSSIEFANKIWNVLVGVKDFTISIPVIVRTGAQNILPILAFASFSMIIVYLFRASNKEDKDI